MKKLALIALIALTASCAEDDEQESALNMLATGKWNLSGVIINLSDSVGNSNVLNIFDLPECPECLKDDQIEIFSSGHYQITLGEKLCDNNVQIFRFKHEGMWRFNQNEDEIILNPGQPDSTQMDITELTESMLQLTFYDTIPQLLIPNDTTPHNITIQYQH